MNVLAIGIVALATVIYAYWLYQTVIAVRALAPTVPFPRSAQTARFAIVVPAHDEEAVIGVLLESLAGQRYPIERVDTYVSCDRCTDRTAEIAAARGATVLTAPYNGSAGKSSNLAYALGEIPLHRYDAVAIFDADNVAHPEFLARMNDALAAEPSVPAFQGYLDVKNPRDSWVTTVYALSFWYANRFWQLARSRTRLAVVLGGTGQVIRTSVLAHSSGLESLTDDLELTCRIVLGGERVVYVPDAIAYDEKPKAVEASVTQRERWLRGHYWSFRRFAGALMRSFLRTGELRYLDLALHLTAPGRASVLYVGMFTGLAVALLAGVVFAPFLPAGHPLLTAWPLFAFAAIVQCLVVLVVAPSIHDRRLTLRYLPAIGPFLLYGLVWVPRVLTLPLARRAPRWVRTEHSRALTLADIERAERRRSGR